MSWINGHDKVIKRLLKGAGLLYCLAGSDSLAIDTLEFVREFE